MGSFSQASSALGGLGTIFGIPTAITSVGQQVLNAQSASRQLRSKQDTALAQLQARQKFSEEQNAQNAVLEKERIATAAKADTARRQKALRRSVARQKTLFSAQGISPSDSGSNEAVLLGLVNDSLLDQNEQDQLTNLRNTALNQSLSQQSQKNLLEATQLRERQNLQNFIDFERAF